MAKKTETKKYPKPKSREQWEDRLKFQCRMPRFMMDQLDDYAHRNQISRNKIIQDLIEEWLEEKGLVDT
jgi:hypothetical protein